MCQIAAQELGTPLDAIFTQDSSTYQIANASPTAASSGSDLNGMAVKNACDQLNDRLKPYREKFGKDAPLKEIVHAAYLDRVNLAANGFWKMPRIGYKWGEYDINKAKPMYYYFTQGAGCSEVEIDLLTGDSTVLRTDLMMVRPPRPTIPIYFKKATKAHRMLVTRSIPRSTTDKSRAHTCKAKDSSRWRKRSGRNPANYLRAGPAPTRFQALAIYLRSLT